jgi:NitT/TauT family transport system permease protein
MKPGWARLAVVCGGVALLEALCRLAVIPHNVLIPPSAMADALIGLLRAGRYDAAIVSTLGNVALASSLAIILGCLLGAAIHAVPRLRHALDPLLASYYAVPTFLFYPVLIVFFGVGRGAIVATAVLMAIVVMVMSTLSGLDQVPRALLRTAAVMHLGWMRRSLFIVLPSCVPYLFSGAKLAVAYGFIGVIASEFLMSDQGLGYSIANAYNEFDNRTMYGLMLLVVLVVTLVNGVLHMWDERLQRRVRR